MIKFSENGYDYEVESADKESGKLTLKTYDKKTKMNVVMECQEDETTDKRWGEFWEMFARNEARKIGMKS